MLGKQFCVKMVFRVSIFLVIFLCLNVQLSDAFRRKTIKEHTKNVTDFNIKQLFPTTWVDSIQQICSEVFQNEIFECKNNVFINVLTPQKDHRLTNTPEGGFIFAYATFAFIFQIKKACIENDLELDCGCNACRLHYPGVVCDHLEKRSELEAWGGCDPKSRHAMMILEHFMESYLDEVRVRDEERAQLIERLVTLNSHHTHLHTQKNFVFIFCYYFVKKFLTK